MDTLLDVQNKLYKLYEEARKKYPFKEDEDWIPADMYDDDKEEPPEVTDRLVYMTDEIRRIDDDDFLSLIAIYYLTFFMEGINNRIFLEDLCNKEDENYYNEKIDSMVHDTKEDILENLKNPSITDDYLSDMIDMMLYHDFLLFDEDTEIDEYEDYEEWEELEKALNESSIFKSIFEKLHPNLKAEEKEYKKYKTQCYNMEKLLKIIPKSTEEFITIFTQAKRSLITTNCVMTFLEYWMDKIKEQNPELIKRIMIIIHRYYYVKQYLEGNGEDAKDRIAECIECIDDLVEAVDIIEYFAYFDVVQFSKEIAKVPEKDLKVFEDLINIENTMVYGTNGIWKKYERDGDLDCADDFYNRCNSWIDAIGSITRGQNERAAYVYFTEDKDKNMTIPRILFIYDCVENKLFEVLGRTYDGNVELELIDILEEKLKELDLLKDNELVINNLKYLNVMWSKIKSNTPLTNEEIDFIYEITEKHQIDFDCNIKMHHFPPKYISQLRKKSGDKKNLSQYFNCREDQVVIADEYEDSNYTDDMVVATALWHRGTTCNYPNLKAVLGCFMATTLNDAYSLDNLEVVCGDVFCESLKSSKHLEKLTRIGGIADFSGMYDTSHFNPNLVIERTARFKDDKKPNIKILNKDK